MNNERLDVQLDTIGDAARTALKFVDGLSLEGFLSDEKTQSAVMMCFIRIGEAANQIERRFPEFIESHPGWPWSQMRAMRNRGAHGYRMINFRLVWGTLEASQPLLIQQIEALGPLDPRQ